VSKAASATFISMTHRKRSRDDEPEKKDDAEVFDPVQDAKMTAVSASPANEDLGGAIRKEDSGVVISPASTAAAASTDNTSRGFVVHWSSSDDDNTTTPSITANIEGKGHPRESLAAAARFSELHGVRLESACAAATKVKDDDGDKNSTNHRRHSTVTSIDFDCPSWSIGWVTVPLQRGHVLRVVGRRNNVSNSSCGPKNAPSFAIYAAHDPLARPTVISTDWQRAVDDIVQDHYCHNNSRDDDNVLPPATNKHFAHASYFQEDHAASYFRDDDNDADDNYIVSNNGSTPPPNKVNDDDSNAGFQIVVCGAKGVGKSTCLR